MEWIFMHNKYRGYKNVTSIEQKYEDIKGLCVTLKGYSWAWLEDSYDVWRDAKWQPWKLNHLGAWRI